MARPKYSVDLEGPKAYIREARISPKDSAEIARQIKGMNVQKAKALLNKVIKKEKAIPYRKHYKKVPHRKGKGWKPGKYPVKASKKFLELIQLAEQNAIYQGLDPNNLVIKHVAAHPGIRFVKPDYRHRRMVRIKKRTTNLEIILQEK